MKVFVVLATVLVAVYAGDDFCYQETVAACDATSTKAGISPNVDCHAKYGGIVDAVPDLQRYVNKHVMRSFDYLLMSTHFANYQKNRVGFEKLYRKMSDAAWENAIGLIKYITKRGGTTDFNLKKEQSIDFASNTYELDELQSLAKAVDIQKEMAKDAFEIHKEASSRSVNKYDAETISYIEEEFSHKQAEVIRELSGHAADLRKILGEKDHSLGLYLFDEYLQKL